MPITVTARSKRWTVFVRSNVRIVGSNPISLRSILILSTHLCLGFLSGLFPSGFPISNHYRKVFKFTSHKKSRNDVHFVKGECIIRMDCNSENIPDRDYFVFISVPQFRGNPLLSVEMKYFRTVKDCTRLDHIRNDDIRKELKIKSV
jgi:hypothetical protein